MARSLKQTRRRFLLGIALYLAFGSLAWAEENPWQALRSGTAVGLLRHALAPGVGDPAQFRLEDCATQRNLSAAGRQQARAIGAAFRRNGIRPPAGPGTRRTLSPAGFLFRRLGARRSPNGGAPGVSQPPLRGAAPGAGHPSGQHHRPHECRTALRRIDRRAAAGGRPGSGHRPPGTGRRSRRAGSRIALSEDAVVRLNISPNNRRAGSPAS